MSDTHTCPRRPTVGVLAASKTNADRWRTGAEYWGADSHVPDGYDPPRTCTGCGSAHPEDVLVLLATGWDHEKATGKTYKGYLHPPGYLSQMLRPGGVGLGIRGPSPMVKFYTPHFDSSQIVELNAFLRSKGKR